MNLRILVALLICFSMFIYGFNLFRIDHSEAQTAANEVRAKTVNYLEYKYDLNPFGSGGKMYQGNIKQLYLAFQVKSPKTKDELRQLVYECMNFFLYQMNSNKKIRPYLAEYPCSFANVQIDIFNDLQERDNYTSVSIATFMKNNFIFKYNTPSNSLHRVEESFEEAMKYLNLECH